ncbi:hypothetical protein [Mycetocola tolaasinivorans]|nr:hypothetical protein [Mycetocola tolaasinivorans]
MGQDFAVHVGPTSTEVERRGAAAAAASWLGSSRRAGLVVSTSHTSESERALVRAVTDRIPVRGAWAHSVRHGNRGIDGLDALIVVAPDAELLEWVIARAGEEPVVVLGANAHATEALLARGSRPLRADRVPAGTPALVQSGTVQSGLGQPSFGQPASISNLVSNAGDLVSTGEYAPIASDYAPTVSPARGRRWAAPFSVARVGA